MDSRTDTRLRASPPPWHVRQGPGRFPHVVDAEGDLVCLVVGSPFVTEAQALANARRLAAAPELLAACEGALDSLEYVDRAHPDLKGLTGIAVRFSRCDQLRAAITAATEVTP